MGAFDEISSILGRYANGAAGEQRPDEVRGHYDSVAPALPSQTLASGISAALRSHETPPFPQLFARMFRAGTGPQRAGLLGTLVNAAGPALAGSVLSRFMPGGGAVGPTALSPAQADQIPPEAAEELARHAEQQDPSVVDRVGQFSAQHPALVKALEAGALTAVLRHVAHNHHA